MLRGETIRLSHNKGKCQEIVDRLKRMGFFLIAARSLFKCTAVCWLCSSLSFTDSCWENSWRSRHQDDFVRVLKYCKFNSNQELLTMSIKWKHMLNRGVCSHPFCTGILRASLWLLWVHTYMTSVWPMSVLYQSFCYSVPLVPQIWLFSPVSSLSILFATEKSRWAVMTSPGGM